MRTCPLSPWPAPTIDFFTTLGAYSATASPARAGTSSAMPRAWPSLSVAAASLLTKVASTAASSGRNSSTTRRRPSWIVTSRAATSVAIPGLDRAAGDEGEPIARDLHHAPAGAAEPRIDAENANRASHPGSLIVRARACACALSTSAENRVHSLPVPVARVHGRSASPCPAGAPGAPSSSAGRCPACSAPPSCAGSAGTSTCSSARRSSWSGAAPASPPTRNCWRRWSKAAPARATSASRSTGASPSTGTDASSASVRCRKSLPRGTGCNACCARRSTRRIIISGIPSSASSRMDAGCACISRRGEANMPIS